MSRGFQVEQITQEMVVIDYDQKFRGNKLKEVVSKNFNVDIGSFVGEFEGIRFIVHAKNITYLGNPWEKYKKRIQIWPDFPSMIQRDYDKDLIPLVIGVYHYNDVLIFADFDVDSYLDNYSNNSAAHIHTYDLQRGLKRGIYSKMDRNGHLITVFTPDHIVEFLRTKLCIVEETAPLDKITKVISDFYVSIPTHWDGVECYQYLVEVDHPKSKVTEWPGFYHEALFENYINDHKEEQKIVKFQQNKTKDALDFDLFYPELKCYGDLKCHTIGESEIIGNDLANLMEALKNGSLYYVICEHTTEKDAPPDYPVLNYWNDHVRDVRKRGSDIEDQKGRMKASVDLIDFIIVEIDNDNCGLLGSFQKGFKNSNGKPREEKFTIPEKVLDEFTIYKDYIVSRELFPEDFPDDTKISNAIIAILDDAGKGIKELVDELVAKLKLSDECKSVLLNNSSDQTLLEFSLERVLIRLRKKGRLKQTRRGGIKIYKRIDGAVKTL